MDKELVRIRHVKHGAAVHAGHQRPVHLARVHDVASARGGVLKGIPQGERGSVACFDDLEDVRMDCREIWPTRGTDPHVQRPRGPSESEYRIFKARLETSINGVSI